MNLLTALLPKAVLSKIQWHWWGKQKSASACDAVNPCPIWVSQVWSYSPNENEEWLCLRSLKTGEIAELKTQYIQSPIPDMSCRLVVAAKTSVTLDYSD